MLNPLLIGAPCASATALLIIQKLKKNNTDTSNNADDINKKKRNKESNKNDGGTRLATVTNDDSSFTCERVCASDRLLKRLGGLSKDPTEHACVTVCGMSSGDSCAEACERVICANPHSVPSWNDQCMNRCKQECLRGRTSSQ
jgi:hypothetical protein